MLHSANEKKNANGDKKLKTKKGEVGINYNYKEGSGKLVEKGQEGKVACMEFETERERKSRREGEEEGTRSNEMEGLIIGRDYKE